MIELTPQEQHQLSNFENHLDVFKPTWAYRHFIHMFKRKKCLFTGNQSMKTSGSAHQYVDRIIGTHPVPKYNVLYFECTSRTIDDLAPHGYYNHVYETDDNLTIPARGWEKGTWNVLTRPKDNICPFCGQKVRIHKRKSNVFRFAAESLPTDKESTGGQSREVKNSVYPEFKRWLPDCLIKREGNKHKKQDISVRNPSMTLVDPWRNTDFDGLFYQGNDIIIEFVSYNQTVQAGAGVQRISVWTDEEAPFDFEEEQGPRLLSEDGDQIYTLTPANRMTWTYDSLFDSGDLFIRTDAVKKFLNKSRKKPLKSIETTHTTHDIGVIQAATDDNPTLAQSVIEEMYDIPDPDNTIIPTRRYGVFKQATGRIFKDFSPKIHIIHPTAYFYRGFAPEEMSSWVFARTQDWHPSNAHAISWAALSPTNECFVYKEWSPSPDTWNTERICEEMARKSGNTRFKLNVIDPLANTPNPETTKSTIEEMNRYFLKLKRDGIGAGGFWQTFNTKSQEGRDAIKTRLANSVTAGKPFNNMIQKDGRKKYLPTIWIFDECKETARSLRQWRLEEWANNRQLTTKEKKEKPAQRYSHFCTALEGLFKDKRFKPKRDGISKMERRHNYFNQNPTRKPKQAGETIG